MKRGQSGLSLLVAVNKPSGMSSHDVVNACRRIFGERRVGHTGTLDPLATGLLPICIGPATRLDKYLTGHDKRYIVRMGFGYETTTDDASGEPTTRGIVMPHLYDESYAKPFIESLIGSHEQLPPQYSAIKVDGVKAYEAARKGKEVALDFRTITIRDAKLLRVHVDAESGLLCWDAEFLVSKGTYIRSLVRDIGRIVGAPAHMRSLERVSSGNMTIEDAHSLETLANLGETAAIDPVAALGTRYAFLDENARFVESGNVLFERQVALYAALNCPGTARLSSCTASTARSYESPREGETVAILVANRLKAIYRYSQDRGLWKPDCVFSKGVARG